MNSLTVVVLLGFVVLIYAIRSEYDIRLDGKLGFLSFFFEAKDRRKKGPGRRRQ
jgi:hypothetical protein